MKSSTHCFGVMDISKSTAALPMTLIAVRTNMTKGTVNVPTRTFANARSGTSLLSERVYLAFGQSFSMSEAASALALDGQMVIVAHLTNLLDTPI